MLRLRSVSSTDEPIATFPMPQKIRELIRRLEKAGFVNRGGKGDHRNFEHRRGIRITISGRLGDDAKPYQEKETKRAIEDSELPDDTNGTSS